MFGTQRKAWEQTVVPVLALTAYAAGQAMYTPLEIPSALVDTQLPSRIVKVLVTDLSAQNSDLSLHFFARKPTVAVVDQTAFIPAAIDLVNAAKVPVYIGRIAVANGDYYEFGTSRSSAQVVGPSELGLLPLSNRFGRSIWMQIVCEGTPTYAAASDLKITLLFEQDL